MSGYLIPVVVVVVIALLAGIILTLAAKFMAVPVDETAVLIREALPGANCGACGYAGCDQYAAALAADHTLAPNLCIPGGAGSSGAIASILGVDAGESVAMQAFVRCSGTPDKTDRSMEYQGYKSCSAAKLFFGGDGSCKFGCMGMGDCVSACAYDAIGIVNGIACTNPAACTGCGACAKACPQKLIDIMPAKQRVFVVCNSCDPGGVTNKTCKAGCIACKMCEKECKFDAIHVVDNLAVIDYEKCKNCTMCAKKCPKNLIMVLPKPGAPAKKQPAKIETAKAEPAKADAPKAAEPKKEAEKPEEPKTTKAEATKPAEPAKADTPKPAEEKSAKQQPEKTLEKESSAK